MKSKIELEIVFPSQEEVSIFVNKVEGEDKKGELLLFSRYAIQQMGNFGGDETLAQIASYLIEVSKNFLSSIDPDAPVLVDSKSGKKRFLISSIIDDKVFDCFKKEAMKSLF